MRRLIFVLLAVVSCVALARCDGTPQKEINALMDLYTSTNGEQWTRNTNWMSGDPCDPQNIWFGLLCTSYGSGVRHIWYLSLYRNNLQGTIPSSIADLNNLQLLQLTSNFLSGTIPEEVFSLSDLLLIDLQSNKLTGTIPDQIGKLSN